MLSLKISGINWTIYFIRLTVESHGSVLTIRSNRSEANVMGMNYIVKILYRKNYEISMTLINISELDCMRQQTPVL